MMGKTQTGKEKWRKDITWKRTAGKIPSIEKSQGKRQAYKLVCKVWYKSGDRSEEHKYSRAGIPSNAVISKSKIAVKIKNKRNFEKKCYVKYLLHKQICIQKLVSVNQ